MPHPAMASSNQPPNAFNFARYVTAPGPSRPADAVALTMIEGTTHHDWTWADIWGRMAGWQRVLDTYALPPEARVAICLPNCVDIPALMLAAGAIGLIPVVLSPQLSAQELAFITSHCGASLRIGGPRTAEAQTIEAKADEGTRYLAPQDVEHTLRAAQQSGELPRYADTSSETPGYMVYTSGTTGQPRGVLHAHRAVWARTMMFDGWTGIRADDTVLHSGQLNWTYAMGLAIFDAWAVGARSIIYEGTRNAGVWGRLIKETRATIFAAVPGLYRQMVRDIPDLKNATHSLRHALCAGEPLPIPLWQEWTDITHKPLYEALGMSECSTYVSSGPQTPTRPGSPGRPQDGRRVAILPHAPNAAEDDEIDDGARSTSKSDRDTSVTPLPAGQEGMLSIHQSDPGLMLEYYRNPEATRAAYRGPWFLTGDLASMDSDGYLHYRGRSDDTIIALGYRIGPTEVEAVLSKHPAVSEVAVTGYSPREGLVLVCAHLVLTKGAAWNDDCERSIRALAAQDLAEYKQPRVYKVHDALPRNSSGKILRRALSALE